MNTYISICILLAPLTAMSAENDKREHRRVTVTNGEGFEPYESCITEYINGKSIVDGNLMKKAYDACPFYPVGSLNGSRPIIGGIPRGEMVALTFKIFSPRFRACYISQIERAKTAAGKLKLRFHIDAKGDTYKLSSVRSGSLDPAMEKCIQKTAADMVFPVATGGLKINYPLSFSPN
jgi:hypothetical protein